MATINSFLWSPPTDGNGVFCGDGIGVPYTEKATKYMFRDQNGFVIPRAAVSVINGINTNVLECGWKAVRVFGPYGGTADACLAITNALTVVQEPVDIRYIYANSGEQVPGTGLPGDFMWFDPKDFYATKERSPGAINDSPWSAGVYVIWPRNGVNTDLRFQMATFDGTSGFPVTMGAQGQGC